MLVTFRNPMGLLTMPRRINKESSFQAALPKFELERLFRFTGIGVVAISWIAYAILLISCITIFINLFKTVKERAFDMALMRTYGATNFQLIKILIYEGFIIVTVSLFLGGLLTLMLMALTSSYFATEYNMEMLWQPNYTNAAKTILIVFITVIFAVLLSIYPLLTLNISKILSNEK
ncbi:FtsX-like permease family protein [Aequorivita echinoideorum]|uniref:FtsX-like permease family protein n=1 Tax=Aequorivita echinoideorum TaxID=1549647 RepID=UPI001FE2A79A|nr:FtsX-like permease family protein [Aequorivita echinoideorum]